MRKKKIVIILLFIFVILLFCMENHPFTKVTVRKGKVIHGVLDIKKGFSENKVFSLDGKWGFSEGIVSVGEAPETYIEVPGLWSQAVINGKKMSYFGFGTYQLKVQVPEPGYYCIFTQYISSAYKLFVNSEEIYSSGKFGNSYKTEKAYWNPAVIPFYCDGNEADIVIQISNYHSYYGGLRSNLYFGTTSAIYHLQIIKLVKSAVLIGIFFGCGIFIVIINKSLGGMPAYIWLGLFCVFSIFIVSVLDGQVLFFIFPYVSIGLAKRFQILSIVGIFVSMHEFAKCFFPRGINKKILIGLRVLNSIFVLLGLFTPVNSIFFGYFYISIMICVNTIGFFMVMINALIQRQQFAGIITFGICMLVFCSFFQLLYYHCFFYNEILSSYSVFVAGVIAFLLCQFYVLSKGIRKNYEDSKAGKDMEIAFLQAQISPHFFFNVINNIYYLMEADTNKAKSLLINFSSYLRVKYKFDFRNTVYYTLQEEIDLLQSFVEIENVRLNQQIEFKVIVDKELLGMLVLPLTLQPLVENAIKHGYNATLLEVTVSISQEGDRIHFMVQDNGKGMGRDRILQIEEQTRGSKGVGIKNINYRLDKCYHTKLIIHSQIMKGTKIEYYIPLEVKDGSSNS